MASEATSNRLWLGSCLIAYLGLGGILGVVLYQRAHSPVLIEEAGNVAGETAAPLEGRIDPNIAEWYDLTRLPRVGEGLARRVVAYRQAKIQEWREAHPNEPAEQAPRVFAHAEDLRSIKGIGPKTLEQLRPFLRFDATTTLPADGSN